MSPVTASRRRDAAQPSDDFDWPPSADDLSVYELGPDPWQKLQDASSQAFAARRRELSQPLQKRMPQRAPERVPERAPERPPRATWKRAGILAALVIVAAASGWALYAAMTRPVPVQTIHHPAPAAAVKTPPPPITIVATYPVEPDPASTAPAGREPAINGAAARPDDSLVAESAAPAVFEALAPAADTLDAGIRSLLQRYEEARSPRRGRGRGPVAVGR